MSLTHLPFGYLVYFLVHQNFSDSLENDIKFKKIEKENNKKKPTDKYLPHKILILTNSEK